jgi:hypothetical protein
MEAGSNTSTVALRVVAGNEKGTQCPGAQLGHPVPGGYKYEDLTLQVGEVSNLRQQNMVTSPAGLGLKNDCAGETSNNCKRQTRLSTEEAPHINKPATD